MLKLTTMCWRPFLHTIGSHIALHTLVSMLVLAAILCRNPAAEPSSASAQRILLAIESEKARMDAHDAMADQGAAKADQVEQQLQQELDQVLLPNAPSCTRILLSSVSCAA